MEIIGLLILQHSLYSGYKWLALQVPDFISLICKMGLAFIFTRVFLQIKCDGHEESIL